MSLSGARLIARGRGRTCRVLHDGRHGRLRTRSPATGELPRILAGKTEVMFKPGSRESV